MIVAAVPIVPPDGDKCWAFFVINDTDQPIESVVVESVGYEWGDYGNATDIGARFGPIAPNACVEVHRETDTEVRTSLMLCVHDASGSHHLIAEVGRLYATPGRVEPIPILGRDGKRATIERAWIEPAPDAASLEPAAAPVVRSTMTVEVDELGVRLGLGDGARASIGWSEIDELWIVATEHDSSWVLRTAADDYAIAWGLAESSGLSTRLHQLPGFDHEGYVETLERTDEGWFLIWKRAW